jgi:hypothetical protein
MQIKKRDGAIDIADRVYRSRKGEWKGCARGMDYIEKLAKASTSCADFEHASGYAYADPPQAKRGYGEPRRFWTQQRGSSSN